MPDIKGFLLVGLPRLAVLPDLELPAVTLTDFPAPMTTGGVVPLNGAVFVLLNTVSGELPAVLIPDQHGGTFAQLRLVRIPYPQAPIFSTIPQCVGLPDFRLNVISRHIIFLSAIDHGRKIRPILVLI